MDVTIPPIPSDPDALQAWVKVMTAKTFNDQGQLVDLSHEEWLHWREKLEASGWQWPERSSPREWHIRESWEAERKESWFATVFHLKKLVALGDASAETKSRLANAQARLAKKP